MWLYSEAFPKQHSDHDGNFGSKPGGDSVCIIPGRYSIVECCRVGVGLTKTGIRKITFDIITLGISPNHLSFLFPELFLMFLPLTSHRQTFKILDIHFSRSFPSYLSSDWFAQWVKHAYQVMLKFHGCLITPFLVRSMSVRLIILICNLSCLMIKPTKWLCTQQRLRLAWASTQSDQSLRCALNG